MWPSTRSARAWRSWSMVFHLSCSSTCCWCCVSNLLTNSKYGTCTRCSDQVQHFEGKDKLFQTTFLFPAKDYRYQQLRKLISWNFQLTSILPLTHSTLLFVSRYQCYMQFKSSNIRACSQQGQLSFFSVLTRWEARLQPDWDVEQWRTTKSRKR